MLAIGQGFMALSRLLMLDEPSSGLAPWIVGQIFKTVREINRQGATILLAEQSIFNALNISQTGYVLENGRVVLQEAAREILNNEHIKGAYLGI